MNVTTLAGAQPAGNILAAFASPYTQAGRIVRLEFAADSGLAPDLLLAYRVHGHEAVSENFRFTVEALSADSLIELKGLLGQGAALALQTADGGERTVAGIVTRAEFAGSDGGMARYLLTLEPALATLAHRVNSRTFQDEDVVEIVQVILQEHMDGNPIFARHFAVDDRTGRRYPQRSYCLQYRESDLAFVLRLLTEEGIAFYWDYSNDDMPVHTLVLFDDMHAPEPALQSRIRFHRADGTESEDSVTGWNGTRQIAAGVTSLLSFDYRPVTVHAASERSRTDQGEHGNVLSGTLEHYDYQAPYYGADEDEMARYAQLRQQAGDMRSKTFCGSGTVRALGAGCTFELQGHPVHDQDLPEDRQFVVLSLDWHAQNLLPADAARDLQRIFPPMAPFDVHTDDQDTPYRCTFEAVRRGIPIVPAHAGTARARPTARGTQTATVVGPTGEEIFTDDQGRIKVQFHWQRPQDHSEGEADRDGLSSTWVRVIHASAGAQWGTQHIPRIGQEVVIEFLEGDIDRPVCVGVVHNGTHLPPAFSGAGALPANKALSGTKTKELHGTRYNELLFDDTANELRTRLSSEHGATQLNQGYLIHPRTVGKGEPRGEGFELRTDAAGAIRAAHGLLLSAEAQAHASGRQLERQALLHMLEAAQALAEQLGEQAQHQHANLPETGKNNRLVQGDAAAGAVKDNGHQAHLKEAIVNLERDTNTDKDRTSGNGGQGIVALTAPDGIAAATQGSMTMAAGTNLDCVALRDTSQTSGRRWIHNAAESISLFVSGSAAKIRDTFKLIAAKGNMQLQAQGGQIAATAQQDVNITSVGGRVVIQASREILLAAGGGYLRIGANIDIHNPGRQSQKAAAFALSGPASMSPTLPHLPAGELMPADLLIDHQYHDKESVQAAKFEVEFADGMRRQGYTDTAGTAHLRDVPAGVARIRYKPDNRQYERIEDAANPGQGADVDD